MGEKFLSPRSDLIFKLLFGNEHSVEILTDFLKSVLRLPVSDYDEVTIVDPYLLREYDGDKLGILDVKLKTKSKRTIDIEIQVKPAPEFKERVVFYSAKMIAEQVGAGEDYSLIKQVISIIITDYTLIPESPRYHNHYTLYSPETHSEFTDLIEVNTLELSKLPDDEDGTKLWNWMKFLNARSREELDMIAERSPEVKKAVVKLLELSNDERTRMLYESRQKMEWDNVAREMEARLDERYVIAKNALNKKLPVEDISEITGLSRQQIETLSGGNA